ncbi:MAG: ISL3 family transposase [Solirubrobacteraceae bacterium]
MRDEVTAASVLLGLPGFQLLAVSEHDGEIEQAVETTADVVGCPGCGVVARLHARRPSWIRDLPCSGRPVTIVWVKRVWRCREPACPVATWTETHEAIGPRMSLTERARAEACRRVGQDGDSVAAVARAFGAGWATIMDAVVEHGTPLVDDPARLEEVKALGTDETAFLAASQTHHTLFVTGFVDLDNGRLLDIVENRCGASVSDWLAAHEQAWRDRIETVALDPHRGYRNGLIAGFADRARRGLPGPAMVVDHFHAIQLANAAIDDTRRRVQQDTFGHRGRTGDPLYGIRRILLRGHERLDQRGWGRLLDGLAAGDPREQVGLAWIAKEELRRVYAAHDLPDAHRRLVGFYTHCTDSDVPEVLRLARTISAWEDQILAYFTTGKASNGRTEATNHLIKKTKRIGHGFRSFRNYRLRLLLSCGVTWNTHTTTPIRGRLPRLAA